VKPPNSNTEDVLTRLHKDIRTLR